MRFIFFVSSYSNINFLLLMSLIFVEKILIKLFIVCNRTGWSKTRIFMQYGNFADFWLSNEILYSISWWSFTNECDSFSVTDLMSIFRTGNEWYSYLVLMHLQIGWAFYHEAWTRYGRRTTTLYRQSKIPVSIIASIFQLKLH